MLANSLAVLQTISLLFQKQCIVKPGEQPHSALYRKFLFIMYIYTAREKKREYNQENSYLFLRCFCYIILFSLRCFICGAPYEKI